MLTIAKQVVKDMVVDLEANMKEQWSKIEKRQLMGEGKLT